ncbi:MAG: D-2-hydroxyacid dehydrogenase [Ardenticatenaceae bacterium]|nr:D-2-hydroxyacid dehydrogenase [Ardenticatenaceae bacterium]MCB9443048.1 D-2-hydroxyacid dehydrogenase [Ardenticatenaceae bacterium]
MVKVLVTAPFSGYLIDKIRAVSPELAVEQWPLSDGTWPDDKTTDAEIYYATNSTPRPEQAPNLRWVQVHWAGIDRLLETPVWNSDIAITNTSGIHAPNMAQYTMTQILAWAHRVPKWFQYQKMGKWPQNRWDKFVPDELHGRTLGIVGYGSIGREIARLAKPFGMKILVSKRDARQPEDSGYIVMGGGDPRGELPDRIYPGEATRSMLAKCDYVVITLPLTEKTRHFFDESLFKEMKPTAFLVNVGRGSLINEPDLIKALKKGMIAGAGLDVFETEPLPPDSPLWTMDNVILTPHVSGFTPYYDDRAVNLFTENLRRYLAGEKLLNLVNREYGY